MKQNITAFLIGIAFALGLGISQMTKPPKILSFLNLLGDWDPTLLVVFISALGVYLFFYFFAIAKPFRQNFEAYLKDRQKSSLSIVAGAVIFGIGWGITGLCPGPAITDLTTGKPSILLFVAAMVLGMLSVRLLVSKVSTSPKSNLKP